MTTLWQAEPELSLTDRNSTVVRAFFESLFIAEWSRTVDAFPGFADLIAASDTRVSETDPDRDHPWSGTRRLLLRSVAVSGDEVRAVVCDDRSGMYLQSQARTPNVVPDSSSYLYGPGGHRYMESAMTWYVVMRKAGDPAKWPRKVDEGSSRAPNWNAFAGWKLVDRGFDAPWQPGTTCDKWAQQNYPGVIDPGPPAKRMYPNGFPDPAFQPTLEQSPGWTRVGQP
ncbi:hypothetical protein GCM10022238_41050 [Gordonia hankookensis]|uniref:hypothetical protein n=1 Tax=Gordonia hankookensis TaxID=589403 RepID=UPI0031EC9B78